MNPSITISAELFKVNKTYQFMVQMSNRQNQSLQLFEYLNVQVQDTPSMIISCLSQVMCSFNGQFHYVNPTTELALQALCLNGNCSSIEYIQWNLFPLTPTTWFFGLKTSNLTIIKNVFLQNNQTKYWRFELIYSFEDKKHIKKTFDIEINEPPRNGQCSFDHLNGSSTDLFIVTCSKWDDEDGIKDYTIYWKTNSSFPLILNYSNESSISIQFPLTINKVSTYTVFVRIQDIFDCFIDYHLPIVTIHRSHLSNFDYMEMISVGNLFDEINDQIIDLLIQNQNDI